MEFISSKNIFLLIKDTLELIDERTMDHGSKVAYFLWKMLEIKGGYEKYEIADMVVLATFHDIGSYKIGDFSELVRLEYKDFMPHSIYGYLFLKYLSPLENMSKVLLYHHLDYKQLKNMKYEYEDLTAYLNIADRMEVYTRVLGNKFNKRLLERYAGTRFSKEGLDLFYRADEEYNLFGKIKSGEFKQELEELYEYLIFANDEKEKYLEMLTYSVGFRSRSFVENEITCLCVADELAARIFLEDSQRKILHYGALLHDIGMLVIPSEIIEAPRKLTKEEMELLRTHVETVEKVLRKNSMDEEVIQIVAAHHERADGSGYPRRLSDKQMTKLQKLLQVADVVTGLANKRKYRDEMSKAEIVEILTDEVHNGRLNKPLVNIMITFYDEIMAKVNEEADNILQMYHKLNTNYDLVSKQFVEQ